MSVISFFTEKNKRHKIDAPLSAVVFTPQALLTADGVVSHQMEQTLMAYHNKGCVLIVFTETLYPDLAVEGVIMRWFAARNVSGFLYPYIGAGTLKTFESSCTFLRSVGIDVVCTFKEPVGV